MTEFKIIDERPITLSHLKAEIDRISQETGLTFRGEKTKNYLEGFATEDPKRVEELREQIEGLNIPRLKDRHIIKVLDVMPTDIDSLKILFSGETLTISDDDLKRILDVIPQ